MVQLDLEDLRATINTHPGTQNNFACGKDYTKYLMLQSAFQSAGNVLFSINPHSKVLHNSQAEDTFLSALKTMLKIASEIPLVANEITDLQVIKRMSEWELARSFRSLYQWYTNIGPNIIEPLIELHFQQEKIKDTSLAQLVNHVMEYVRVYTTKGPTRDSGELLLVFQVQSLLRLCFNI